MHTSSFPICRIPLADGVLGCTSLNASAFLKNLVYFNVFGGISLIFELKTVLIAVLHLCDSMATTGGLELKGPLSKSRKNELEAIADMLQISKDGTKPVLLARIQNHFKDHLELATDPHFQPLFVYRPATSDKREKKSSADKAAEDTKEENKKEGAAIGYI
jgi:hypothetical protein